MAAASRVGPRVDDLLECPICYTQMERPLQLSCGHTFCGSCIDRMVENARPARGFDFLPWQPMEDWPAAGMAPIGVNMELIGVNMDLAPGNADRDRANRAAAEAAAELAIAANAAAVGLGGRDNARNNPNNPVGQAIAGPPPARARYGGAADDFLGHGRFYALHRLDREDDINYFGRYAEINRDLNNRMDRLERARDRVDRAERDRRIGRGTLIRCPECRRSTTIPRDGLPVNFRLQEMINHLRTNPQAAQLVQSSSSTSQKALEQPVCDQKCNHCNDSFNGSTIFLCRQCNPEDDNISLCAMCCVRGHNGHHIEEKRMLTEKDVQAAKEEIGLQAARAVEINEHVHNSSAVLSNCAARLQQTFNNAFVNFGEIGSGLDNSRNLTFDDIKECTKRAEDLSQLFKGFMDRSQQLAADNNRTWESFFEEFNENVARITGIPRNVDQEQLGEPVPNLDPENDVMVIEPQERNRNEAQPDGDPGAARARRMEWQPRERDWGPVNTPLMLHRAYRNERARARQRLMERMRAENGDRDLFYPQVPRAGAPGQPNNNGDNADVEPIRAQAEQMEITPRRRYYDPPAPKRRRPENVRFAHAVPGTPPIPCPHNNPRPPAYRLQELTMERIARPVARPPPVNITWPPENEPPLDVAPAFPGSPPPPRQENQVKQEYNRRLDAAGPSSANENQDGPEEAQMEEVNGIIEPDAQAADAAADRIDYLGVENEIVVLLNEVETEQAARDAQEANE